MGLSSSPYRREQGAVLAQPPLEPLELVGGGRTVRARVRAAPGGSGRRAALLHLFLSLPPGGVLNRTGSGAGGPEGGCNVLCASMAEDLPADPADPLAAGAGAGVASPVHSMY